MTNICPNCGEELDFSEELSKFHCPSCQEPLWIGADQRVFLANPITTYQDETDAKPKDYRNANARSAQLSVKRWNRSARSFAERISEQKKGTWKVLLGGFFFLLLGTALIVAVTLSGYFSGTDLLSWSAFLVGICSLGAAVYFLLWAWLTRRSFEGEEEELSREYHEIELLNSLKD